MPEKKRSKKNITFNYLSDIVKLHMNYEILLTEKIGFLVAIAALILTLTVSEIIGKRFLEYPILVQISLVIVSVGAAIGIILTLSAETPEKIKRVKTFHPLSITEFNEESSLRFNEDLKKIMKNDGHILRNYSSQIMNMKNAIYKKSRNVGIATKLIIGSVLFAAFLACIQLYIGIFSGV